MANKKTEAQRAKNAGLPMRWSGMRKEGIKVRRFVAARGLVVLEKKNEKNARRPLLSYVRFQRVGGRWVFVGDASPWTPIGVGGR